MSIVGNSVSPEQRDSINRNQCDVCHWFVEWASHAQPVAGKRLGTCQRRSPQYQQIKRPDGTLKDTSKWPTTKSTDRCGDYRISVELLAKLRVEREAARDEKANPIPHGN